MKKQTIFRGAATALITPFSGDEIDYASLGTLIDSQIRGGIDALVIAGTTGEAATLDDTERYSLFRFCTERIAGRVKLILGVGTNDTRTVLRHADAARACGCDGLLAVTPYYNRGTRRGVVKHFLALAEHCDLPIIVYNVPSRTGVDLTIEQLSELSMHERIVGIKEASDSIDKMAHLGLFSDSLDVYAGSDSGICETLSIGGKGVISVVSNLYPCEISELCHRFFQGDMDGALKIQRRLMPFIDAAFCETNPAPIKYAMSISGYCKNELRLPLYPISQDNEARVRAAML